MYRHPERPEEDIRFRGAGAAGGFEAPSVGAGNQTLILLKNQALLTASHFSSPAFTLFSIVLAVILSFLTKISEPLCELLVVTENLQDYKNMYL